MHLERKIRQPNSLREAEIAFRAWCGDNGYEIVGHLHSFLQKNLFTEKDDALVEATVRRKK